MVSIGGYLWRPIASVESLWSEEDIPKKSKSAENAMYSVQEGPYRYHHNFLYVDTSNSNFGKHKESPRPIQPSITQEIQLSPIHENSAQNRRRFKEEV